jgi:hypothetical protein
MYYFRKWNEKCRWKKETTTGERNLKIYKKNRNTCCTNYSLRRTHESLVFFGNAIHDDFKVIHRIKVKRFLWIAVRTARLRSPTNLSFERHFLCTYLRWPVQKTQKFPCVEGVSLHVGQLSRFYESPFRQKKTVQFWTTKITNFVNFNYRLGANYLDFLAPMGHWKSSINI